MRRRLPMHGTPATRSPRAGETREAAASQCSRCASRWEWAFGAGAVAFVATAVSGVIGRYSPVPLWDMWDGYLDWFLRVQRGDWLAWWEQHNEHRIVLTRLLFWVDLKWLGGSGWLPVAVTFLCVGAAALLFWLWLKDAAGEERLVVPIVGLFLVGWLFLWAQNENLGSAFQTQFVLAQLVPLAAFYAQYRSIRAGDKGTSAFVAACVLGVAAVGTMANGVLTLPLMTAYALLAGQSKWKAGLLGALAVLSMGGYFYGYHVIAAHGSVMHSLTRQPLDVVKYVAGYLGSPFYFVLGGPKISTPAMHGARKVLHLFVALVAAGAGLALVFASGWLGVRALRRRPPDTLELGLLAFIAYIILTAVATAGGRLIFGWGQAFSSRYATPALMAWAALLVLLSPSIVALVHRHGTKPLWAFATLGVVMMPLQFYALVPHNEVRVERNVGALALELQVQDPDKIEPLYPIPDRALAIAKLAAPAHLSVFGVPPLRDLSEQMGKPFRMGKTGIAEGAIDSATDFGDPRFVRVRGWMYDPATGRAPATLAFVDTGGDLVGYAYTGEPRPDLGLRLPRTASLAGFEGYVLKGERGRTVRLVGIGESCATTAVVPQ